jgi:TolA-binding protein
MISVRLSEAEYDDFCRLSAKTGAHSLSDLARDAMRLLQKLSNHDRPSNENVGGLQAQMDQINRRIDELRDHLMSSEGRAKQESYK